MLMAAVTLLTLLLHVLSVLIVFIRLAWSTATALCGACCTVGGIRGLSAADVMIVLPCDVVAVLLGAVRAGSSTWACFLRVCILPLPAPNRLVAGYSWSASMRRLFCSYKAIGRTMSLPCWCDTHLLARAPFPGNRSLITPFHAIFRAIAVC